MKKNLLFLAAAVLASAVSCTVEEKNLAPETDLRVPMEFTAGTPDTKTELDPSSHDVIWTEDDIISIFDGSYNNKFTITSEAGGSSASFAGKALESAPVYLALYPYSATAECNTEAKTITSVLPSEQKVTKEATFAPMVNPSVAVASGNQLTFKNVASILQVDVANLAEGQTVTEISASADGRLAGAFTVDASAEKPSAVAVSSTNNYGVKLTPEGVTDLNGDGVYSYSLVVLPGSYSGLTVTVTYSDGAKSTFTASEAVEMPVSDGRTLFIDASKAEAPAPQTLYDKFMAGEDIEIGGKTYNKAEFAKEDGTYRIMHMTEGGEGYNISSSNKGMILFIEPEATILSFSNQTNLIIVGNNPEIKTVLTIGASKLLAAVKDEESRLIFYNLDIKPADNFAGYMFGVSTNFADAGAFGEFVLDNCDLQMTNGAFYSISNARYLDRFVMQNCNVAVPEGSGNRFILHMGTHENHYSEIIFKNNIFQSSLPGALSFRLVSGNNDTKTSIDKIAVENNTFVNTAYTNSALILANAFEDVTFTKNLVYLNNSNIPDPTGTATSISLNVLRAVSSDGYPVTANCVNNIVYHDTNNSDITKINMFYDTKYTPENGSLEMPSVPEVSPFEGGDLSTFTPSTEFAEYGAQR